MSFSLTLYAEKQSKRKITVLGYKKWSKFYVGLFKNSRPQIKGSFVLQFRPKYQSDVTVLTLLSNEFV
eukprot:UN27462